MKKIIALVLSAVILCTFAACGNTVLDEEASTDEKANTSTQLTKITFALDWTPNTNHTGLYVAKEKGYFAQAGLDVDIVYVAESSSTALCATGNAQFAIEAQDTMAAALASDNPLDITAVAAILQHNTSGIISRKGEGIDSPKGLSGNTYSTWDSPVELAMLESVVESDGGNFDDVTLIPNTITDEPGALAANQTDAIWVFYGWGGINADVRNFEYDFFFIKDIDAVFDYYTPVIIGNNEYMEQNPETTKAFLAAVKKGYEYAAGNPDDAAQILINSDNTGSLKGSEELVKRSQQWISSQYIADAESWGVIDENRWNAFYKWLNDNDLVEKELPEGTGFTNEYLS